MIEPEHPNHVKFAYGKASISARGFGVLIVLCLLAIVGSNLYAGLRLEKLFEKQTAALSRDHKSIGRGQEQATCILALTTEERLKFREDRRPDAWVQWCWWITRQNRDLDRPE